MEYIFIALLLGTIAAFIARDKGFTVPAWFILGFLFGVFAIIVELLLKKVKIENTKH